MFLHTGALHASCAFKEGISFGSRKNRHPPLAWYDSNARAVISQKRFVIILSALIRAEKSDALNAILFFFHSVEVVGCGTIPRAFALKDIRIFREIKIMDTNCTSVVVSRANTIYAFISRRVPLCCFRRGNILIGFYFGFSPSLFFNSWTTALFARCDKCFMLISSESIYTFLHARPDE